MAGLKPAVVRIVTALQPDNFGDQDPLLRCLLEQTSRGLSGRAMESGLGSGVIVTADGYILTNGHVFRVGRFDPQLLHTGVQRCALNAQELRRAQGSLPARSRCAIPARFQANRS